MRKDAQGCTRIRGHAQCCVACRCSTQLAFEQLHDPLVPRFLALVAWQNEGKVMLGVVRSLSIMCADREDVPWVGEVLLTQAFRGVLAMLILAIRLVVEEQLVDLLHEEILHLR